MSTQSQSSCQAAASFKEKFPTDKGMQDKALGLEFGVQLWGLGFRDSRLWGLGFWGLGVWEKQRSDCGRASKNSRLSSQDCCRHARKQCGIYSVEYNVMPLHMV